MRRARAKRTFSSRFVILRIACRIRNLPRRMSQCPKDAAKSRKSRMSRAAKMYAAKPRNLRSRKADPIGRVRFVD